MGLVKMRRRHRFDMTDASGADEDYHRGRKGRRRQDRQDRKGSSTSALIVMTKEDTIVSDKVGFDMGLGGTHSYISVSDDGMTFTFRKSGMYRFVFSGLVNLKCDQGGKLIFAQSNHQQAPFAQRNISTDLIHVSTILTFQKNQTVSLKITSNGRESPVVGAQSSLEIYRVSSI